MSDPNKKYRGTNHEFVRIGEIAIHDDGAGDTDVLFSHPEAGESRYLSEIRMALGDERFEEALTGGNGDAAGGANTPSVFENHEPPSFKCRSCNRTFARTQKATDGCCVECDGGDDT